MVLAALVDHQFSMGAVLDHSSLMEHSNLIAELAAGQAVTDVDGGLVTGNIVELGVDFRFCNGVKCCGGFVENYKRCILIECPCYCNFLFFTARKVDSVFFIRMMTSVQCQSISMVATVTGILRSMNFCITPRYSS